MCVNEDKTAVVVAALFLQCFKKSVSLQGPACYSPGYSVQPRSQGCIITTLAQSNDSSILIGRHFFIPNSNELLKIVEDANSVSPISTAPPQQTKHRKNSLAGGVQL